MSKRSVQVPLDQERSRKRRSEAAAAKAPARPKTSRRGASAIFAAEPRPARGQPTRKSTRQSANHAKAGTVLTSKHELVLNAPSNRHARRA